MGAPWTSQVMVFFPTARLAAFATTLFQEQLNMRHGRKHWKKRTRWPLVFSKVEIKVRFFNECNFMVYVYIYIYMYICSDFCLWSLLTTILKCSSLSIVELDLLSGSWREGHSRNGIVRGCFFGFGFQLRPCFGKGYFLLHWQKQRKCNYIF